VSWVSEAHVCRRLRDIEGRIIVPRRKSIAHLHRPRRAILEMSVEWAFLAISAFQPEASKSSLSQLCHSERTDGHDQAKRQQMAGTGQARRLKGGVQIVPSPKDAEAWARQMEIQADRSELPVDNSSLKETTLGELINRYRREVTSRKRGASVEDAVLARMLLDPICKLRLAQLGTSDFARYRDKRLQSVAPTTLKRQLNPVQHMFEIAKRDWTIPLKDKPGQGASLFNADTNAHPSPTSG
jgi:hypothetical protein